MKKTMQKENVSWNFQLFIILAEIVWKVWEKQQESLKVVSFLQKSLAQRT